jgi:hypothetical protein
VRIARNPASWLVLSIAVGAVLTALVLGGIPWRTSVGAAPAGTAARSMSVFATTRQVPLELPWAVRGFASTSRPSRVSTSLFEGVWRLDAARLLLSGIGPSRARVYAVPTKRGAVCHVILAPPTEAGGGCAADFTPASPVGLTVFDPDATDGGKPVVVGGVAPDDVVSIQVVVDGRRHRVVLERNAYLYQLAASRAYPQALVVGYADGTTRTVKIPDPRRAMRACEAGKCPAR